MHRTCWTTVLLVPLFVLVFTACRSEEGIEMMTAPPEQAPSSEEQPVVLFLSPINDPASRVTKKPFGIFITPESSPVQPEKFTGYHSGVDFDAFEDERDTDVIVSAICTGPLITKQTAQGYGGVLVQTCTLNDEPITVIYGHIRLSSVMVRTGDVIEAGDELAVLGTGQTSETDGERKHLHLGIHRGTETTLRGYVQSADDLRDWIDIMKYVGS